MIFVAESEIGVVGMLDPELGLASSVCVVASSSGDAMTGRAGPSVVGASVDPGGGASGDCPFA